MTAHPRPVGWARAWCVGEPPGGWTRHLLYAVHPVAGNGTWRWNVAQLRERIGLFDGRRVVAVLWQPGTITPAVSTTPHLKRHTYRLDDPDAVREALAGCDCEVVVVPNEAGVGEPAAFDALFGRAAGYAGFGDVTFYGHAKGVTYPELAPQLRQWVSILYATNLDYWPLVEGQFRAGRAFVGSLRPAYASERSWIYAGTFWWFRNRLVFRRKAWARCRRAYAGLELWPCRQFPAARCACLFQDGLVGDPYVAGCMAGIAAEFTAWSEAHAADRRPGASAEPWAG